MSKGHALFAPSAAHRWMECPGSFAYPNNTADSEESNKYADDGTASHTWAAMCLKSGQDAAFFIDTEHTINGKTYYMDEERAGFIQVYLDAVRQLALGHLLFVEHWVDTSEWLGEDQGGTIDAAIIEPGIVTVVDLKYGMGERVDAWYTKDGKKLPNHQLAIYAAGLIRDAELLGNEIQMVRLMIVQPRLGHISSRAFDPADDIMPLLDRAEIAAHKAGRALIMPPADAFAGGYMYPGEKTCRWCCAKAECPALAKYVSDAVRADFDTISAETLELSTVDTDTLSKHMIAVPLVEDWCAAVRHATHEAVGNGQQIIGSDGLPMKFVEGKLGNRAWTDEKAAEAALAGQLPPEKMYKPQEIITAPQAAKIFDKGKTKQLWKDAFEPLTKRSPGKPVLALGSDERPPYSGQASAEEFDAEPT